MLSNEFIEQLQQAQKSNPDLSVLELIEFVLETYLPYKEKHYDYNYPYRQLETKKYRRTNNEILKCLMLYNERK